MGGKPVSGGDEHRRCGSCDAPVAATDRICFACGRPTASAPRPTPVSPGPPPDVVSEPEASPLQIEVAWGRNRYDVDVPPEGRTFGSTANADVVISAAFLSPVHARISFVGSAWQIAACDPNGRVLAGGRAVPETTISAGDVLRLADAVGNFATIRVGQGRAPKIEPGALRGPLPLREEALVIGSDPACAIRVHHPLVRPRHARLRRDRDGVLTIEDRVTVAGTYVNGDRLRQRLRLTTGDTIQIGPFSARIGETALEPLEQVEGVEVSAPDVSVRVATRRGGSKQLLRHVNVRLRAGSLTAIAGKSGAGKSTLMRLLSGQLMPTEGAVTYDHVDLAVCRQAYARLMGFVPQDDVVHPELTVAEALRYQARLRLGREADDETCESAVRRVLGLVAMVDRSGQLIRTLSGGQRKRVSIATELINEPKILFLDEPTSGLDPGLDKQMMLLLRQLADQGRTVILTTHAIAHIDVCDSLVLVGPGGSIVYSGEPNEAARWLDGQSLADAFFLIDSPAQAEAAARRLQTAGRRQPYIAPTLPGSPLALDRDRPVGDRQLKPAPVARPPFGSPAWREIVFYQGRIFAGRQVRLMTRDRPALAFSLGQGVAVALLTALVAPHPLDWSLKGNAPMLVFGCAAVWFGMINAVRELVKERVIWRREQLAGGNVHAYLLAKLLVLGVLAAVQAVTTLIVLDLLLGLPVHSPLGAPAVTIFVTLWLATVSGTATALIVSALAAGSDRAMSLVPYLLITQLVLCGVLFPLRHLVFLSWIMPARWTISGLGGIAGLSAARLHQTAGLYPHTGAGLVFTWLMLLALSCVGVVATGRILQRQAASWSVG